MVRVTVFTGAYNRAYCIDKLYESLRRQTLKDFLWLIIDDGSTDDTQEKVKSWQNASDNGETGIMRELRDLIIIRTGH